MEVSVIHPTHLLNGRQARVAADGVASLSSHPRRSDLLCNTCIARTGAKAFACNGSAGARSPQAEHDPGLVGRGRAKVCLAWPAVQSKTRNRRIQLAAHRTPVAQRLPRRLHLLVLAPARPARPCPSRQAAHRPAVPRRRRRALIGCCRPAVSPSFHIASAISCCSSASCTPSIRNPPESRRRPSS
jgi:hypothetical protein